MAFACLTARAVELRQAGIRYIFTGHVLPEDKSLCRLDGIPSLASRRTPDTGRPGSSVTMAPGRISARTPQTGFTRKPAPGAPVSTPSTGTLHQPLQKSFQRISLEQWPDPWQKLFSKTKRGWLAWTYWDLGADLCGHADTQRRQCLARLIRDLNRPAGTHTFWPICLPVQEEASFSLQANPEIFWSGLHELGARVLIIMGSQAARQAGITKAIQPLQSFNHNGLRILMTWDFDHIFAETTRYKNIVNFLGTMLNSLGR